MHLLLFLDGWWNSEKCWLPVEDENGTILNPIANSSDSIAPVEEFWK